MTIETTILVENISTEFADSSFSYTDKKPAAGYHNSDNVSHVATYSVQNFFVGTIKLQGTLEIYPGELDWVDIVGTEIDGDRTMLGGQSLDPINESSIENVSVDFTGSFVWIRAAYNIQHGSIVEIRYNY